MKRWKVETTSDCEKYLKKKVWEIRSLQEFRDFLNNLAGTSFGRIFYMPLALKFGELYEKTINVFGLAMASCFAAGVICGYVCAMLL